MDSRRIGIIFREDGTVTGIIPVRDQATNEPEPHSAPINDKEPAVQPEQPPYDRAQISRRE